MATARAPSQTNANGGNVSGERGRMIPPDDIWRGYDAEGLEGGLEKRRSRARGLHRAGGPSARQQLHRRPARALSSRRAAEPVRAGGRERAQPPRRRGAGRGGPALARRPRPFPMAAADRPAEHQAQHRHRRVSGPQRLEAGRVGQPRRPDAGGAEPQAAAGGCHGDHAARAGGRGGGAEPAARNATGPRHHRPRHGR